MAQVLLGLGSNLGDRLKFLRSAMSALDLLPGIHIRQTSGVYETEPFGEKDQPQFLNAVAEIETTLEPTDLFTSIKSIERSLGRTNGVRWGPREIDIDILLYDSRMIHTELLDIPHQGLTHRRFVLEPIVEICPGLRNPESDLTMTELLRCCADPCRVVKQDVPLMEQKEY